MFILLAAGTKLLCCDPMSFNNWAYYKTKLGSSEETSPQVLREKEVET